VYTHRPCVVNPEAQTQDIKCFIRRYFIFRHFHQLKTGSTWWLQKTRKFIKIDEHVVLEQKLTTYFEEVDVRGEPPPEDARRLTDSSPRELSLARTLI
jgi:hypothetical protein